MNLDTRIGLLSGRSMPIIGLGTWELTKDTAGTVLYALELGYRLIDTSSDYGSQPGIGEALKQTPVARSDIYLVAKVEEDDDAYVATKEYLNEMRQDYADLMLIHRPPGDGTAGHELWDGLIKARGEGLTIDIGVSNYSVDQIEQLISDSGVVPVVNQIEWSPFGFSDEMKAYCDQRGIIIMAYSPLTRRSRTGDERLRELADKYSKTPEQILLRWSLQMGTVPIPKANSRDHLRENIDVFDFDLSAADMAALNQLNHDYSALMESLPYTN